MHPLSRMLCNEIGKLGCSLYTQGIGKQAICENIFRLGVCVEIRCKGARDRKVSRRMRVSFFATLAKKRQLLSVTCKYLCDEGREREGKGFQAVPVVHF